MPHTKIIFSLSLALVTCALLITACDEKKLQDPEAIIHTNMQPDWKLDTLPDGAVDVAEAKTKAKEGEQVTLIGLVGGRSEPISASSGLFVIMDPSIPSCADMAEDHCATPWDYCCETPETITANAATIQLLDAKGNPVSLTEDDLQPLSRVAVVGTVAPRPNRDTLVVYATGLYVVVDQ